MPIETFTRKPTRVKMVQWTGHNQDEIAAFCGDKYKGHDTHPRMLVHIRTANGHVLPVQRGEYIAMDAAGYPYPIAEDVHAKTYQIGNQQFPGVYKVPRRFELHRNQDITGVSGEGVVVCGVQWYDGSVQLMWNTAVSSTTRFPDIDSMMHIHGHDGATKLVWLDQPGNIPMSPCPLWAEEKVHAQHMFETNYDKKDPPTWSTCPGVRRDANGTVHVNKGSSS
jgi:hypothetical protein